MLNIVLICRECALTKGTYGCGCLGRIAHLGITQSLVLAIGVGLDLVHECLFTRCRKLHGVFGLGRVMRWVTGKNGERLVAEKGK